MLPELELLEEDELDDEEELELEDEELLELDEEEPVPLELPPPEDELEEELDEELELLEEELLDELEELLPEDELLELDELELLEDEELLLEEEEELDDEELELPELVVISAVVMVYAGSESSQLERLTEGVPTATGVVEAFESRKRRAVPLMARPLKPTTWEDGERLIATITYRLELVESRLMYVATLAVSLDMVGMEISPKVPRLLSKSRYILKPAMS